MAVGDGLSGWSGVGSAAKGRKNFQQRAGETATESNSLKGPKLAGEGNRAACWAMSNC